MLLRPCSALPTCQNSAAQPPLRVARLAHISRSVCSDTRAPCCTLNPKPETLQVHRPPPPPRNRPLPEPRAVKVTLVTAPSAQGVQLALAASAAMPAAEAAAAAAEPTQAATAAAHAQEQLPDVMASPGAVTSAGSEAAARQDAAGGGQDAIMAEAAPAAPAAQPETPAAAAAAPAQPAQQPHQPAAASKTAADKPMPQRAPARGAAVGTTAVVAAQADMMLPSTDMSHEEICAVLDQVLEICSLSLSLLNSPAACFGIIPLLLPACHPQFLRRKHSTIPIATE